MPMGLEFFLRGEHIRESRRGVALRISGVGAAVLVTAVTCAKLSASGTQVETTPTPTPTPFVLVYKAPPVPAPQPARGPEALKLFGRLDDDRAIVFIASGPPDARTTIRCPELFRPVEVWTYLSHPTLGKNARVIFYPEPGTAAYRYWTVLEGEAVILAPQAKGPLSAIDLGKSGCADAAFLIAGGDPHLIEVESGESVEDFLESSGEVVALGRCVLVELNLASQGFDLASEVGLFVPEQLAADPTLVVQLQELAPAFAQRTRRFALEVDDHEILAGIEDLPEVQVAMGAHPDHA